MDLWNPIWKTHSVICSIKETIVELCQQCELMQLGQELVILSPSMQDLYLYSKLPLLGQILFFHVWFYDMIKCNIV
jgi:hypothetical protein